MIVTAYWRVDFDILWYKIRYEVTDDYLIVSSRHNRKNNRKNSGKDRYKYRQTDNEGVWRCLTKSTPV